MQTIEKQYITKKKVHCKKAKQKTRRRFLFMGNACANLDTSAGTTVKVQFLTA